MKTRFYFFLSLIIIFYVWINYYIGSRIWESFFSHFYPDGIFIFWIILFFLVFSYTFGRLFKIFLPKLRADFLIVIGAYWMGATVYFLFIFVILDLLNLISRFLGGPLVIFENGPIAGGIIIGLMIGLIGYGVWSATNPKVSRYKVAIHKYGSGIEKVKIVVASDLHLGSLVSTNRVNDLVQCINDLNPDLILLPGDIVDDDIFYVLDNELLEPFKELRAKYGVYASTGNHEYIGGHADRIAEELEKVGVTVLRDQRVLISHSFYLIGREDLVFEQFTGTPRKDINELTKDLDHNKPILILDHQPTELESHKKAGVDLQVSGHTHKGQLFPFHLVTRKIFKIDWGCLKEDSFYTIVSSGFGTWGPPIRIGNRSEIVKINVVFKGQA